MLLGMSISPRKVVKAPPKPLPAQLTCSHRPRAEYGLSGLLGRIYRCTLCGTGIDKAQWDASRAKAWTPRYCGQRPLIRVSRSGKGTRRSW